VAVNGPGYRYHASDRVTILRGAIGMDWAYPRTFPEARNLFRHQPKSHRWRAGGMNSALHREPAAAQYADAPEWIPGERFFGFEGRDS
jgi:hypothetical protein